MRLRNPAFQIHMWGGLGSQLFGLIYAISNQRKRPRIPIRFVLHTDGVTRREPEILKFTDLGFDLKLKDDFRKLANINPSNDFNSGLLIRKHIRKLLVNFRIVVEGTATQTKPWTLSARGHYFGSKIEYIDALQLYKVLQKLGYLNLPRKSFEHSTLFHYRLGDLLHLEEKSAIPVARYLSVVSQLSEIELTAPILSSDSPEEARNRLNKIVPDIKNVPNGYSAWEFLNLALATTTFIGSNSKLSIWAFIFRCLAGVTGSNYLPNEFRSIMEKMLPGEILAMNNLKYF